MHILHLEDSVFDATLVAELLRNLRRGSPDDLIDKLRDSLVSLMIII